MSRRVIILALLLLSTFTLWSGELPPDSEYVVVSKDGHLEQNGQRRRFWSAIGSLIAKTRANKGDSPATIKAKSEHIRKTNAILVQRLVDLGFNSVRMWTALPNTNYTKGDASSADAIDNFIYQAKAAGMKVWLAGLNRSGSISAKDVNIINDPTTAKAWQDAITQWSKKGKNSIALRDNLAKIWDERLEALNIKRLTEIAVHKNQYTNLRWCDDPVFAIWEVSNEEWWLSRFLSNWTKVPDFFKESLYAKWNSYLLQKYSDDKKLISAWGTLLEGESLTNKNIIFAPTQGKVKLQVRLNDGNALAIDSIQADKSEQSYSREDFSEARAADVLEFLTKLWLGHKERTVAALKPLGKSTRLSPWIYDTGIGYSIQSQYIHQSADAVAHDAYIDGWSRMSPTEKLSDQLSKVESEVQKRRLTQEHERLQTTDGVWRDALKLPPGICSGVPWLEHNRVDKKPFLCYETQIQQPAKYRTAFPIQIATLGSLQDWDWICWHYFTPAEDLIFGKDKELPWAKSMDYTTGSHPQGYHFTYDEVQLSAMRAAGYIFRKNLVAPIETPTKFIYGRKSLYNPDSMDYGGSYGLTGQDMLQTTYQHGVRIEIDPNAEEDKVIGPVVKFEERNTFNPYTPSSEVIIDWKKGFIKFDTSSVATFAGTMANYGNEVKFAKSNLVLKSVKMHNPAKMTYPITDKEKYITFNVYSEDRDSLDKAKNIGISLVSTSMNANYKFPEKFTGGHPNAKSGGTPLVTRVSATIEAPFLKGMTFKFYDWHMREIGTGILQKNRLDIPADKEIFFIRISR